MNEGETIWSRRAVAALALMCAVAAQDALAYRQPQDSLDGVTASIRGFDEDYAAPSLALAAKDAAAPVPVEVALTNGSKRAVSGVLKVWLNDDWTVDGPVEERVELAAGEAKVVARTARARPSALAALYPVHAAFAFDKGTLHPIAVFSAKGASRTAWERPGSRRQPKLRRGVFALDRVFAHSYAVTDREGRTRPMEGGGRVGSDDRTRATFCPSSADYGGVLRRGWACHPPWRKDVGGSAEMSVALDMPKGEPAGLRFFVALRTSTEKEGQSDGVGVKVKVKDDVEKTVFSRLVVEKGKWLECEADLSEFAGRRIELVVSVDPGPKGNTCCDGLAIGDADIEIGPRRASALDGAWRARENAAEALARAALASGTDAAAGRFRLADGADAYGAGVALGDEGLLDCVVAFTDGRAVFFARGFRCRVDDSGVKAERCEVKRAAGGVDGGELAVEHWAAPAGRDGPIPLRARVWAEKGALRVAWDMPGVARAADGRPRYTCLGLGPGSLPASRAYAGFGNVIEGPKNFVLGAGGFSLSARHVGADYANGLSLVQASDIFPDRLVCRGEDRVFSLEAHHDATISLVPSSKGAFNAARRFAGVARYPKGPGVDAVAGRMCLDQWGGDYAKAAVDLEKAAAYGVTNAVFVKHVWQRWGYDYRLPEIWPPRGDADAFRRMARAAQRNGILFCPHDNYIDFYPDASGYSYDHIIFNADGTPQKAWYNKGARAQSYRWLPHAFRPWLLENARLMHKDFAPDAMFIDVFTAMAPIDYYDRKGVFYPKTRTAAEWGRAFDDMRAVFRRPSAPMISEAGTDALMGHVDAGQSDHFPAIRWMSRSQFADVERVPWHDIVTHGRMVLFAGGLGPRYSALDWQTGGDETLHGYGSDDSLSTTVVGGRTPMCNGPFSRRAVMTYWLLHDVSADLARSAFESLEFEGGDIHRQHSTFGGGEVFVNRSTNSAWRVAGHELPPFGFHVKTARAEAGVVSRGGRRIAFAKGPGGMFFDARSPAISVSTLVKIGAFTATSRSSFRLRSVWEFQGDVSEYHPFVHIVPADKPGVIVCQGGMDLPAARRRKAGVESADIIVSLPDSLAAGEYEVRYGLFLLSGPRLNVCGITDGSRRVCGGRLRVAKKGGRIESVAYTPPEAKENAEEYRLLGCAQAKARVDFGAVATDGAFRIVLDCDGLCLLPLPETRAFEAEIDLAALGLAGRRVASVAAAAVPGCETGAAPTWRQSGDRVSISADARSLSYRLSLGGGR